MTFLAAHQLNMIYLLTVEGLEPGGGCGGGSSDPPIRSLPQPQPQPPPPVVQLQHQLSKTSGSGSGSLTAAPSPTTPAAASAAATMAATTDPVPEALRQLPDHVRQVLHGCVLSSSSSHGTAVERGSNLVVYVTSADPTGNS